MSPAEKPAAKPSNAKMGKRILFSFDSRSLEGLRRVQKKFGAKSLAEAVRLSLQLADSLQTQADDGYREIVVRSSKSGKERVMAGLPFISGTSDD